MSAPRIAVCQLEIGRDVSANLARIRRMTHDAADSGADLALFPEASVYPIDATASELLQVAGLLETEIAPDLRDVASTTGVTLVVGVVEPSEARDKVLNTVLVVGGNGSVTGAYRKIHLYDAFGTRESDRFLAGPLEPLIFDAVGCAFGILTCYDVRFPELARVLVDAGADALLVPAAWAHGMFKEEHWQTLLRARAIENTVYVAGAGQCGPGLTGRSAVVDPLGVTVCALGELPGVATALVDRDRIFGVRERLPVLANRRLRVSYESANPAHVEGEGA